MENNFIKIKNKKKNRKFLKENGFTKLKSAIFNPKSKEFLLIDTETKSFWVTCKVGFLDASKIIEQAYNQKIQTIKNIELCLQKN